LSYLGPVMDPWIAQNLEVIVINEVVRYGVHIGKERNQTDEDYGPHSQSNQAFRRCGNPNPFSTLFLFSASLSRGVTYED